MPLFRFNRGGLQKSLDTTVIVKDVNELMNVIKKSHKDWCPENIETFDIIIEPYPDYDNNFDERIGWYTQMVTSDIHQRGLFIPEGFLSEPLE